MSESFANDIAVLKSCVTATKPDYDSLSDENRYLLSLSKDFHDKVRKTFISKLFGIKQRRYKRKGILGFDLPGYDYKPKLNPDQQYRYNAAMLSMCGIGECRFLLTESLCHGKTLLDYSTLHDYEYDYYLFQKSVQLEGLAEQWSSTEPEDADCDPYYGIDFPHWARLYIDGEFFYATLYSAFRYCLEEIEETIDDILDTIIPHTFVKGPEHGKKTDNNCTRWNMVIDASGKEPLLEHLKDLKYFYLYNYRLPLLKAHFDMQPNQVFMLDKGYENYGFYDKNDPHVNIVFSNKASLHDVRLDKFWEDLQPMIGDEQAFRYFINGEKGMAKDFIMNEFNKLNQSTATK